MAFEGKTALVTGAGKGIGRALAKALLANGATTYALSRTKADLDTLKNEYPNMHIVCVDLTDWKATRKAVEAIGFIDLLVNNAGMVGAPTPFLECSEQYVDSVFGLNFKAIINVSQVVAKGMVRQGKGGRIVNISSIFSARVVNGVSIYCASKAAVDQLTKSMSLELGPQEIRVNAVNPTVVHTTLSRFIWDNPELSGKLIPRTPVGRFAETADIVSPVLYLLSDQAAMINGVTLMVDGGFVNT